MEKRNELEIGIGTIELEKQILLPEKVKIVRIEIIDIERVKARKVNCLVKHSNKEELITLSSVSYIKDREIITKGLWFNLDEENNIQTGSVLANFLNELDCKTLKELEGKEVNTEIRRNYLVFKCY